MHHSAPILKCSAGLMIAIAVGCLLVACGSSSAGETTAVEASANIGPEGGTVQIAGIATIEFPAGAFNQTIPIHGAIETMDANLLKDYEESSSMSSAGPTDGKVLIITVASQPLKDSIIKYRVPAAFLTGIGQAYQPVIFGKFLEYGAQDEELEDVVNLSQSIAGTTITAKLPRALFTSGWARSRETSQAIVILGSRPGDARDTAKSASFFLSATAAAACSGRALSSPLGDDLTVTSPFGERLHPISGQQAMHYGVDLRANTGDDVFAVADGFVEAIEFNFNPNTGKGYGRYIILLHSDGSKTKYAHLEEGSTDHLHVGDSILAGTVIGRADTTGGATGSHLHLEYDVGTSPGETRVDPFNCIIQPIRFISTSMGEALYWPLFNIPFEIALEIPEHNCVKDVRCDKDDTETLLDYGCSAFNMGSGRISGQVHLLDPRGTASVIITVTDCIDISQSITISDSWDCCESNDTAHYMGVIRSCIALGDTITTTLCPVP